MRIKKVLTINVKHLGDPVSRRRLYFLGVHASDQQLGEKAANIVKKAACPPNLDWTDLLVDPAGCWIPENDECKRRAPTRFDLTRKKLGTTLLGLRKLFALMLSVAFCRC